MFVIQFNGTPLLSTNITALISGKEPVSMKLAIALAGRESPVVPVLR